MKRKQVIIACLLYVILMAAFFIYHISKGQSYLAMVAIGGIVCGAIPLLLTLFTKLPLYPKIIYAYLIFIFGSQFLGSLLNWYDISWWDTFMHFISGGILALIGLTIYENLIHKNGGYNIAPWFVFLITFAIAALGGVLWEIYEFLTDQIFGTTLQGVGVTDTMTDLMGDVSGGLLMAVYAGLRIREKIKKNKNSN